MTNPLEEIARARHTDKLDHGYLSHYYNHMPDRDHRFSILEVGIFEGNSLRMWRDYYSQAVIYGVDIKPEYIFQENRIVTWLGDGTDPHFWSDKTIPDLEVIIDDGSHQAVDIVKTFNILWPKLPSGGLYIIEDLAVQWYSSYGGTENGSPAIRLIEDLIYEILKPLLTPNQNAIHIYNEIVFIRKA